MKIALHKKFYACEQTACRRKYKEAIGQEESIKQLEETAKKFASETDET